MQAKDDEIARLSKERDKYQALVFERLRTSQLVLTSVQKRMAIEAEPTQPIESLDTYQRKD